jgi:hypothetical protein
LPIPHLQEGRHTIRRADGEGNPFGHVRGPAAGADAALPKDQPGLRRASYFAPRGLTRIQHCAEPGLSDDELKDYRRHSRRLVALGLPKERQREFGLDRR